MKKKYIKPEAIDVYAENLMWNDGVTPNPQTGSDGIRNGETQHSSSKSNVFVWDDDDIEGEGVTCDVYGYEDYSGF